MNAANDNVLSVPSLANTVASLDFAIRAMRIAAARSPKSGNFALLRQVQLAEGAREHIADMISAGQA
jgi:hypothetical protein